MKRLTHITADGEARMVDVSRKPVQAREAIARWGSISVRIHHSVGEVPRGEASVLIRVVSAHRAEAFAACRFLIDALKSQAPIWKREFFEGGDVWIEGATADPDDARARAEAERAACV